MDHLENPVKIFWFELHFAAPVDKIVPLVSLLVFSYCAEVFQSFYCQSHSVGEIYNLENRRKCFSSSSLQWADIKKKKFKEIANLHVDVLAFVVGIENNWWINMFAKN